MTAILQLPSTGQRREWEYQVQNIFAAVNLQSLLFLYQMCPIIELILKILILKIDHFSKQLNHC